jgi:hypothetical protein
MIKYIDDDRYKKCLGIVKSQYFHKNGDSIDVEFCGYVGTGYKNLKPGYDYFIQTSGELDIVPNEFYFGTALTNDTMILK